jgi:hypothetical protein
MASYGNAVTMGLRLCGNLLHNIVRATMVTAKNQMKLEGTGTLALWNVLVSFIGHWMNRNV